MGEKKPFRLKGLNKTNSEEGVLSSSLRARPPAKNTYVSLYPSHFAFAVRDGRPHALARSSSSGAVYGARCDSSRLFLRTLNAAFTTPDTRTRNRYTSAAFHQQFEEKPHTR